MVPFRWGFAQDRCQIFAVHQQLTGRQRALLPDTAIRRGVFLSVADLKVSIEAFLKAWDQDPKPFVWTATVESIQEKLTRCRRTLEQIQPGCTSPKSRKRRKR
jgi:hypothetical protein